jgi:transporter family-2 protein
VSGGNTLAVALSLVAGVAGTVQIAVMGRLGDRIGVVAAFAFAAAVAAAIGVVVLLAAQRSFSGFARALDQPAWMWIGGLMGAIVVLTITYAGPRIGPTATVAVFVDQYGLFGLDRIAVGWPRLVGLALLAAGTALVLRR